jgi:hypothetical protein
MANILGLIYNISFYDFNDSDLELLLLSEASGLHELAEAAALEELKHQHESVHG